MHHAHNIMECHIEYQPYNLEAEIWFYFSTPSGTTFLSFPNKKYVTINLAEDPKGKGIKPLTLPYHLLKALINAGSELLPPDKAMENHLKDSITVRDRLLTIIEKNSSVVCNHQK